MPLLLSHGWPDSFLRMMKITRCSPTRRPRAATPPIRSTSSCRACRDTGFRGDPKASRSAPAACGGPAREADDRRPRLRPLRRPRRRRRQLGHRGRRARSPGGRGRHPMTDVPYHHLFTDSPQNLSDAEQADLAAGKKWQMEEGAYAMLQSTKPQTLACGLNDSCPTSPPRRHPPGKGGRVQLPTAVALPERSRAGTARICRALLQRPAMDRDAARRPLRSARRAGVAGRRLARVLSAIARACACLKQFP